MSSFNIKWFVSDKVLVISTYNKNVHQMFANFLSQNIIVKGQLKVF